MDDFVQPGVRVRDLVDFVAACVARGASPWAEPTRSVVFAVSPASFVALMWRDGGGVLYVPDDPALLRLRYPFLAEREAVSLCRTFFGEKVELPSMGQLVRYCRNGMIARLRADGLSVAEIARRVCVTRRWVRMLGNVDGGSADHG